MYIPSHINETKEMAIEFLFRHLDLDSNSNANNARVSYRIEEVGGVIFCDCLS